MAELNITGTFKKDFENWIEIQGLTFEQFINYDIKDKLTFLKHFLNNESYEQDLGTLSIDLWNEFILKYNNTNNYQYKNLQPFIKIEVINDLEEKLSQIDKIFYSKTELKEFLENEIFYNAKNIDKEKRLYTFYLRDQIILNKEIFISY